MIKGIGVDITEAKRFGKTKDEKAFLKQVFTNDEIKNADNFSSKNKYWARLFAIKEALLKAFKTGLHHGSYWQDININGTFVVTLSGYFKKLLNRKTKVFVAHSCSKKYAASIAFIQD